MPWNLGKPLRYALGLFGWALVIGVGMLYFIPSLRTWLVSHETLFGICAGVSAMSLGVLLPAIASVRRDDYVLIPRLACALLLAWLYLSVNEASIHAGVGHKTLLFFTTWLLTSAIYLASQMPRLPLGVIQVSD